MWSTACRKQIHGFIDSTAAYIYTTQNVVFLLFRIWVNKNVLLTISPLTACLINSELAINVSLFKI